MVHIVKNLSLVSVCTLLSRIFGFVRDVTVAVCVGASWQYDAFVVALRIPNFGRRLFAEGAFTQAFVPVLCTYEGKPKPAYMRFINAVFGLLSLVVLLIVLLGQYFSGACVAVLAPGLSLTPERLTLASQLLVITFPFLLFVVITAFAAAILNARQHFLAPASAPIVLNVTMIGFVSFAYFTGLSTVHALAWGLVAGGILQLLLQFLPLSRIGVIPKPALDMQEPGVRRVLTLMGPAILGGSVWQINTIIDGMFASFLPSGSISWLYYAERLFEFPIGIIGVALSTVLLPLMSAKSHQKLDAEFSRTVDWGIRWTLLLGVPAAVSLFLLAEPIFITLFQHGAFTAQDSLKSAWALQAFALSLPAHFAIRVLLSAHYSRQNFRFPLKVAICCLVVSVMGNFALVGPYGHVGLALASSLGAWLNVGLLFWSVVHAKAWVFEPGWLRYFVQIIIATLGLTLVVWALKGEVAVWHVQGVIARALSLAGIVGVGVLVYLALLFCLGLRPKTMLANPSGVA
ncbi:MAG: murein biosynthesis integral membrane protein MurJ [Pseudomonadota bacterium]